MTTRKPGCLASLLRIFGLGKLVHNVESENLPYRLRDDFLSSAETSFFQVLTTIIGDWLVICPKVSLAELFFVVHDKDYQAY